MRKLLALLVLLPGIALAQPAPGTTVNIGKYGGTATTLGQKTKAASVPVTLASDEDFVVYDAGNGQKAIAIAGIDPITPGITVPWVDGGTGNLHTIDQHSAGNPLKVGASAESTGSGTITASGQTVSIINPSGLYAFKLYGTYAGLNLTFEVTRDGSTYNPINAQRVEDGTVENTSGVLTNTNRVWILKTFQDSTLRVRATAFTSGTANIGYSKYQPFFDPLPSAYQAGTWNINNVSGTVSLPTGAATSALQTTGNTSLSSIDGKLPALVSGRVPVDGSGVNQPVVGNVAHDAADSGNPAKIGGHARTADPTAVANDDRVDAMFDKIGRLVNAAGCLPENQFSGVSGADITNTTSTSVVAAGGAGIRYAVYCIAVSNMSSTVSTRVDLQDGTTTKFSCPAAAAGGGCAFCSSVPIFMGTANTALQAQNGTTGAAVRVSYSGCKFQ